VPFNIAYYPGFSDWVSMGCLAIQKRRQPLTTPQHALEDGFKSQRIQVHMVPPGSTISIADLVVGSGEFASKKQLSESFDIQLPTSNIQLPILIGISQSQAASDSVSRCRGLESQVPLEEASGCQ
jgi:hypothetical protein